MFLKDRQLFPAAANPPAFTDSELSAIEAERLRYWRSAIEAGPSDEYLGSMTLSDVAENLIRLCPCESRLSAVLKLQCVMRDLEHGPSSNAVDPATLLAEVIQFLEAV